MPSIPKSKGHFSVDKHLLEGSRGYDYALCLIENDLNYLCKNLRKSVLSATINPTEVVNGKTTISFQLVSTRFSKQPSSQLREWVLRKLSMPCDCQAEILMPRNWGSYVVSIKKMLWKPLFTTQQSSKLWQLWNDGNHEESSFQTKYFIDERRKHFVFGKEDHEVLPTGEPHQPHCELNGNFRFGRRISIDRHFNVSQGDGDDTFITGEFPNCHDEIITPAKNRTHLNMFSNDHCWNEKSGNQKILISAHVLESKVYLPLRQ